MVTIVRGKSYKKTRSFLERVKEIFHRGILDQYGRKGVDALREATPKDTGETANSWGYEIIRTPKQASIVWTNSHIVDGVPIAVILQYGHGTQNGVYVKGVDYINPAMAPIFNEIATDIWKEVCKA